MNDRYQIKLRVGDRWSSYLFDAESLDHLLAVILDLKKKQNGELILRVV
jgi:hypothetical protein